MAQTALKAQRVLKAQTGHAPKHGGAARETDFQARLVASFSRPRVR